MSEPQRVHRPAPATKPAIACGACGHDISGITTWRCPACGADPREVGINRCQTLARWTRDSLGLALAAMLGRRRSPQPQCAKCGYAVRGLDGFDCPECGSDLREVGAPIPRMHGGAMAVVAVVLLIWSAFVFGLGVPLGLTAIEQWGPRLFSGSYSGTIGIEREERFPSPRELAYLTLESKVDAIAWPNQPPPLFETFDMAVFDDNPSQGGATPRIVIRLHYPTERCLYQAADAQRQSFDPGSPAEEAKFDDAFFLMLLQDAPRAQGLDNLNEAANLWRREVAEAIDQLHADTRGYRGAATGTGSGGGWGDDYETRDNYSFAWSAGNRVDWLIWALIALLAVIWLAGLVIAGRRVVRSRPTTNAEAHATAAGMETAEP